jgi:NADPH:quinone reductase-like Zn-dependent oxidoreductase
MIREERDVYPGRLGTRSCPTAPAKAGGGGWGPANIRPKGVTAASEGHSQRPTRLSRQASKRLRRAIWCRSTLEIKFSGARTPPITPFRSSCFSRATSTSNLQQARETLVVSAAAGAVGSVAGSPSAAARGVVGIAGGPEKCALLVERLGFDAALDRRAADWQEQLAAATPDGIDVDFENVGGEIMDAIFARLNLRARVVLCGLISIYNDPDRPPGPRNFPMLLLQRARLQGFVVLDHIDQFSDVATELSGWIAAGELEVLETVVEGFEQFPTAINMLFDGTNIGKLVVHVADD